MADDSEHDMPTVSKSEKMTSSLDRCNQHPLDTLEESSTTRCLPVNATCTTTIEPVKSNGSKGKLKQQGARPKESTDNRNLANYALPNIHKEISVSVNPKVKDKDQNILASVCACLNSKKGCIQTLKLKIIEQKYTSTDLEKWYRRIEEKMQSCFFFNISDYVKLEVQSESKVLLLRVTPGKHLCTINTYLYHPSETSVKEVTHDLAIDIIQRHVKPSALCLLTRDYVYNQKLKELQSENSKTQFKDIKNKYTPQEIAEEITDKSYKYISAFSNYEGGCIYFGIDDNGKVVGVKTSDCNLEEIEKDLEERFNSMIRGDEEHLQRGVHWNVHFFDIKDLPEEKKDYKLIAVNVSATPGGVFTAVPLSYYADERGNVQKYTIKEWRSEMISSYQGKPATKKDVKELATKDDVKQLATVIKEDIKKTQNNPLRDNKLAVRPNSNTNAQDNTVGIKLGKATLVNEVDTVVPGRESIEEEGLTNIFTWDLTENHVKTGLMKQLQEKIQKTNCVILKGLSGVGKTEVAQRFCYDVKQNNKASVVWKLTCSDKSLFEMSLSDIWRNLEPDYYLVKQNLSDDEYDHLGKYILKKFFDLKHSVHYLLLDDVKKDSQFLVKNFIKKMLTLNHIKIIVTTPFSFNYNSVNKVIEVDGFSMDEAVEYLHKGHCNSEEEGFYQAIAKRLSCNPMGLSIIQSYMSSAGLTPKELLCQLQKPIQFWEIEESFIIKDQGHEKTLFASLINVVKELHSQYRQRGKEELFKMLLTLQFLEVEKIPLILFANLNPTTADLDVNELFHVVKDTSFGKSVGEHTGIYDDRILIIHEVVVMTLQLYNEIFKKDINTSDIVLRKSLLRSFHMLMDKDIGNKKDYQQNMLLLPHARAVVEKINLEFKKSKTDTELSPFQDMETTLRLICVNDILGYTFSYIDMHIEAHTHFELAKEMLFKILDLDGENFDKNLKICCEKDLDFDELRQIAKEKCTEIYRGMDLFLQDKKNVSDLTKICREYILNKKRNLEDVNMLTKHLGKGEHKQKSKLDGNEYSELGKLGFAVLNDGYSFLCEVVLSTLHTYGRRLFYVQEIENKEMTRFYCIYLYIAHELCLLLTNISQSDADRDTTQPIKLKYKTIYSLVIQRSVIQSTLQPGIKAGDNHWNILHENIQLCMKHLKECDEDKNYLEFGVLKVQTRTDDQNKALWLKQVVGCYKVLIHQDRNMIPEGIKHAMELNTMIQDMKDRTCYPGLVCSLGELQYACANIEEAEMYFAEIIPKFTANNSQVSLSRHQRSACINYIRCRLESAIHKQDVVFHKDTLLKIEAFKLGMRHYKTKLEVLEQLETTAKEKIKQLLRNIDKEET